MKITSEVSSDTCPSERYKHDAHATFHNLLATFHNLLVNSRGFEKLSGLEGAADADAPLQDDESGDVVENDAKN